jgi:uncharacterized membrane protein YebE (DUF533 family)
MPSNPEFGGLAPDAYYRNLSADLKPFMGMPDKKTTKYDKLFSTVGQAVEVGCAAIAAYQAYQSFAPKGNTSSAPPVAATPAPKK